jgi:hypothetical protein
MKHKQPNVILLLGVSMAIAVLQTGYSKEKQGLTPPLIDVQSYNIALVLTPDAHELKAKATVSFTPLEATQDAVFELSENLSVRKVIDSEGKDIDFGQDEAGPGYLTVHFGRPLDVINPTAITIEYQGGFDRDRFSRLYAKDESSAYIGMEGTYLMYSAKWLPINRFLLDRAAVSFQVTVPLGMTVVGPGDQLPVVTKGVDETFSWTSNAASILPGSIVAGQYYQKKVQSQGFTIQCFAKENKLDSIEKSAEAAAKILDYYKSIFGPPLSGANFRLVEVDDQLARQPGTFGTVFVTRKELAQTTPPIRELARRIAYQWWQESVGIQNVRDLWLEDGMAYYSAAQYMASQAGPAAYKEEMDNLAVLALKFEKRAAVREGLDLDYRSEPYESVVAGKGSWILIMLRGIMGDAKFGQLAQQYLHNYAGKGGGTAEFQKLAESIYGQDLGWFFAEWLDMTGVPSFETDYVVMKTSNGFRVSGTVKQDRDLFRMPIEVAVEAGEHKELTTVDLNGKSSAFDVMTLSMPKKITLDPNNKLLRDSEELQLSVQISLGNDLKSKGDYVEARMAYESALKINSHKSLAHFRLGEVYYAQSSYQQAANSFRDALNGDKDPKWIEVWSHIYIGKIYDILGQRQRAMAEYKKALNTKDNTNGAQAEAEKWQKTPYTRDLADAEKDKNN